MTASQWFAGLRRSRPCPPRLSQVTPAALAEFIRARAVDVLTGRGLDTSALPETVLVERPRNRQHGDYATNIALQCAKRLDVPPRELAGWLAEVLLEAEAIASVEVAGPGFLNLRLAADAHGEIIRQALSWECGHSSVLTSRKASQESVSAVPTGPIHFRDTRGNAIAMDGLVDAVGDDAARYTLARSSADSSLDVDLDLLRKQTDENPVFYVQYAHARLASLLRNATELGVEFDPAEADYALLVEEQEGELVRTISEFPSVTESAAKLREPHRIARYLERLSGAYHKFSDSHRVLPSADEQAGPLTFARLGLCDATRRVLAGGLGLLGVSAPERI